ncbi:MAG: fumarate hydratase [Candidatus Omnitrophota bacterium]
MNIPAGNRIEQLAAQANFTLRRDVMSLLRKAYRRERNPRSKNALGWILENAKIAQREHLAICQDTGLPIVFIEVGRGSVVSPSVIEKIKTSIEKGYIKNYLRSSIVDPLVRGKASYRGAVVHIECSSRMKGIRLTLLPKGFGSENKSQLKMFNPTAKIETIENFIVESVMKAGPDSCPPFVVGVGIGGTSDYALLLAKKALLLPIDIPSKDPILKKLETRLLQKINALGLGPMGLGGPCTALAVKIKTAPTHIAGLPVGVNISCHALRSATIKIDKLID